MKIPLLYLSVTLLLTGFLSGCGIIGGQSEYARVIRGVWTPDGDNLLLIVWRFETSQPDQPFFADDSMVHSRIEGYLVEQSRIESWQDGRWLDSSDLRENERVFSYSDTAVPDSISVADGLAGEAYYYNTYFVKRDSATGFRVFMGSGHYPRIIDFGGPTNGSPDFSLQVITLPEDRIQPLLDNHIISDLWPNFSIQDIVPSADGDQLAVFGRVAYFPDPELGVFGPLYYNYIMTFIDAENPQRSPRVLRFSEDAPVITAAQIWPTDPDQGKKLPIVASIGAMNPYSYISERINYSYMASVVDAANNSFVLVRSVPAYDASVLLPFQPVDPYDDAETVQRYTIEPPGIQLKTDAEGVLTAHASGPVRADGLAVEVEIPNSSGAQVRFRLRSSTSN